MRRKQVLIALKLSILVALIGGLVAGMGPGPHRADAAFAPGDILVADQNAG